MDVIFLFNKTQTTGINTLSLHDALPLLLGGPGIPDCIRMANEAAGRLAAHLWA